VVGAEIIVTAAGGGLTRTTTTNGDGAYVAAGLPGGSYNLAVTAKGFQKYSATKVVLDVAQKIRVDVQLTVGAMNEEIVVTGESVAQVETQSSALSSTITGKQVNELELNGRQFTQLAALSPGVSNQTFGATGTDDGVVGVTNIQFSINGGRYEYNNWELDGGDNMDNGSNATLNVYPNLEAIAEFKVLTSNYGAQYGRNGSGTVEVETKSGGNSFHGSAFEYLRNEIFKARSWAEGEDPTAPKAPYKKHDFGYTVGGPIYIPNHYNADKKKTFFFWSQEWRREKTSSTILQNVPSDAERGGDFSDLCPGPDCPSGSQVVGNKVVPSAVGTALLAIIPKANTTNGGFPAVSETISSPTTWREQLIRVDHNLSDNYRLTFRYIHDSWQTINPNPLWGNLDSSFLNVTTNFVGPGTSFVARLNANVTPTLLNEFVASYTGDHIFLTTGGPVAWLSNLLLIHDYFPQPSINLSVNPLSWSLSSEMLFYLSFPFLIGLLRRIPVRRLWIWAFATVAGVFAVQLINQLLIPTTPKSPVNPMSDPQFWFGYLLPPTRLFEFVLGAVLALLVRAGKWPRIGIVPAAVLLLVGYTAALYLPVHYALFAVTMLPVGVLIASVANADLQGRRTPFGGRVMVWLGEVSFAFYLCQGVTLFYVRGLFAHALFPTGEGVLVIIGLCALTLLAGWLLHSRVEMPMMRRWSRARRPVTAAPSTPVADPVTTPRGAGEVPPDQIG